MGTMQTLFWALILLMFVMYTFAATFTQVATEHFQQLQRTGGSLCDDIETYSEYTSGSECGDAYVMTLRRRYGTIPRSLYSLYMAISNGIDWGDAVEPLAHINGLFVFVFLAYITITTYGVLNVVTSAFVESALQSSQHHKELLIQQNIDTKAAYAHHLADIFNEIDSDQSGEVSLAELEVFLTDPDWKVYLDSLDINPENARTLFNLLDRDKSGFVNIDEFCEGCMRLKGEAKSFDVHCLIFDNQRLVHQYEGVLMKLESVLRDQSVWINQRICNEKSQDADQKEKSQCNLLE